MPIAVLEDPFGEVENSSEGSGLEDLAEVHVSDHEDLLVSSAAR